MLSHLELLEVDLEEEIIAVREKDALKVDLDRYVLNL